MYYTTTFPGLEKASRTGMLKLNHYTQSVTVVRIAKKKIKFFLRKFAFMCIKPIFVYRFSREYNADSIPTRLNL